MNQELFVNRGSDRWRAFEELLASMESRKKRGGRDFPRLYRAVCHDLALARQRQFDAHLVDRLNSLALRGLTASASGDVPFQELPRLGGAFLWRARLTPASGGRTVEVDGMDLVLLEGSPDYYGRLGFEPAARHGIEMPLPDWAPREAAQVRRLGAYDPADPTLRGSVVYPAAFDGVE